jgi:protein-S-isoprenylcysteine O-methyltransferase Ste14
MRDILLFADVCCFASFGWAMLRHFERAGKPKPGMIFTASVVPIFAGLHVASLTVRPLAWPWLALILYTAAIALFWLAIAATRGRKLAACFQGRVPLSIVRTGPYRAMRHPFYTAYTLVWLGGFAATGWWPLGAIALVMATLYASAARKEEAGFLSGPLESDYRAYIQTTGRFLPRIGRSRQCSVPELAGPKKLPRFARLAGGNACPTKAHEAPRQT